MLEKIKRIEELILNGVEKLLNTEKDLTKDDYIVFSNIIYNFKNLEISLLKLDLEEMKMQKDKEIYNKLYDGIITKANELGQGYVQTPNDSFTKEE